MESIHDKLKRVRTPRVHITYDVETEGAMIQKELPFVMGVVGDFSGNASKVSKSLKDRRFIQIDRDNFDDILRRQAPAVEFKVENTLAGDGSEMAVHLDFNSMEDFEPGAIVEKVEPLKKLMDTRNQLRDLMTKVDRSEELENILEKVLSSTNDLDALAKELSLASKDKGDE